MGFKKKIETKKSEPVAPAEGFAPGTRRRPPVECNKRDYPPAERGES